MVSLHEFSIFRLTFPVFCFFKISKGKPMRIAVSLTFKEVITPHTITPSKVVKGGEFIRFFKEVITPHIITPSKVVKGGEFIPLPDLPDTLTVVTPQPQRTLNAKQVA
jgi:hypothetical protein